MEQIKIMITIWPVQPVCVVWKHVFLRRPQRDNYCQLNYSACSPCVFWLCAADLLTLSSSMRRDLQPPSSSPAHTPLTPPNIHHNWGTQICTLQMSKMHIYSVTPLAEKKHAGNCMDVSFDFFVWNRRKILFKNPQPNPGCLTEMHTNIAIIGGRKLYSVAVANSLVQ